MDSREQIDDDIEMDEEQIDSNSDEEQIDSEMDEEQIDSNSYEQQGSSEYSDMDVAEDDLQIGDIEVEDLSMESLEGDCLWEDLQQGKQLCASQREEYNNSESQRAELPNQEIRGLQQDEQLKVVGNDIVDQELSEKQLSAVEQIVMAHAAESAKPITRTLTQMVHPIADCEVKDTATLPKRSVQPVAHTPSQEQLAIKTAQCIEKQNFFNKKISREEKYFSDKIREVISTGSAEQKAKLARNMIGRGYSSKRIKQLFERAQLGEQHTARIEAYLDKDSPRYIFIHGIALKKQLNRMQHLREKLQPEDGRMNVQKLLCKTLRTRLFTNLAEIQSYMLERGVTVTLRRLKIMVEELREKRKAEKGQCYHNHNH